MNWPPWNICKADVPNVTLAVVQSEMSLVVGTQVGKFSDFPVRDTGIGKNGTTLQRCRTL